MGCNDVERLVGFCVEIVLGRDTGWKVGNLAVVVGFCHEKIGKVSTLIIGSTHDKLSQSTHRSWHNNRSC